MGVKECGTRSEKKKSGGGEGVGNEMLVAEESKDGGSVRVFFFLAIYMGVFFNTYSKMSL